MLELAQTRLRLILKKARTHSALKKRAPSRLTWKAELALVSSTQMRQINTRFRGKPKATDVLSFEAPDVFRQQGQLGELVICLSVMRKQAQEYGHAAESELDVLLVHGALHLLGFDHERSSREAAAMAQWEARLLKQLGGQRAQGLIGR